MLRSVENFVFDEIFKLGFKTLAAELQLPMARLAFFHECFQDEFGEDENGNLIFDNYPDDPIGTKFLWQNDKNDGNLNEIE